MAGFPLRSAGVVDGVYRWYGAQCRIAILTVSAERQRCRTILGLERLSAHAGIVDPDRRCIGGHAGAEAGIYDRDRGIPDRFGGQWVFGVDGDADHLPR